MASLGCSAPQLGSSFSPPCKSGGPFPLRDVACAQTAPTTFSSRLSWSSEHQQRLAVRNLEAKGVKKYVFASGENFAIFRQSDPAGLAKHPKIQCLHHVCRCQRPEQETDLLEKADESDNSWGVQLAIGALNFYKGEISPLLPGSCRFVPTCSEYSMAAYRTYGVLKGTILTGWRLARCNPLGSSGFDPPRWFGESKPSSF